VYIDLSDNIFENYHMLPQLRMSVITLTCF